MGLDFWKNKNIEKPWVQKLRSRFTENQKVHKGDKIMKKLSNMLTVVKVAVMVLYLKEYRENALAEIGGA
jgi:hypothetical protein